jgi:hypothetical protein
MTLLECFRSVAHLAPSHLKLMTVARLPVRTRSGRLTIGMHRAALVRCDMESTQNKQNTPLLYTTSLFTEIEP